MFFFNDTATTEIYTLSLHDALPISDFPRRKSVSVLRLLEGDDGPAQEQAVPVGERVGHTGLELGPLRGLGTRDRKSTRLNSSHANISYAVFCLKKKKKPKIRYTFNA